MDPGPPHPTLSEVHPDGGKKLTAPMEEADLRALQEAKVLLENPGLAARLANVVGRPSEKGVSYLPKRVAKIISVTTEMALHASLRAASFTLGARPGWHSSRGAHKAATFMTGAVGGFFGVLVFAAELAASTTIMMRAIATIARENGEDTGTPQTQTACLEVFALGGRSESDDGTDAGYYAVRNAIAGGVTAANKFFAGGGKLADKGAPALVKLFAPIAERFSIRVTEKFAAQAVPIIGAAGAALVNLLFINHFQDMATGHFTVRRLERRYDRATVKAIYDSLPSRLA